MSDRDKAGLRGPVKTVLNEQTFSGADGQQFLISTTTEFWWSCLGTRCRPAQHPRSPYQYHCQQFFHATALLETLKCIQCPVETLRSRPNFAVPIVPPLSLSFVCFGVKFRISPTTARIGFFH
jgi:hypothetical protein